MLADLQLSNGLSANAASLDLVLYELVHDPIHKRTSNASVLIT